MKPKIIAIAACDEDRVIGINHKIPWNIPEDAKHFKNLTTGHTVMMGRKTYESLPPNFKPLPNRKNIVVTSNPNFKADQSVEIWNDPIKCIEAYRTGKQGMQGQILWIVGGEGIYRATLPYWDEVIVTRVKGKHEGDTWFPEFESKFKLVSREDRENFAIEVWSAP